MKKKKKDILNEEAEEIESTGEGFLANSELDERIDLTSDDLLNEEKESEGTGEVMEEIEGDLIVADDSDSDWDEEVDQTFAELEEKDNKNEHKRKSVKQSTFLADQRIKQASKQVPGDVEVAEADERFPSQPRKVGRDEPGKNKGLGNLKKENKREEKRKRRHDLKKSIKNFFSLNDSSYLLKLLKVLLGLADTAFNFGVITALAASIYVAVNFLIAGDYFMVAASCLLILTLSYISDKITH